MNNDRSKKHFNVNTGEIKEIGGTFVKKFDEASKAESKIENMTSQLKNYILNNMDRNGNITLTGAELEKACKKLNINKQSITRLIKTLINAEMIKRTHKGSYMMNPYMYARGPNDKILKDQKTYDSIKNVTTKRKTK